MSRKLFLAGVAILSASIASAIIAPALAQGSPDPAEHSITQTAFFSAMVSVLKLDAGSMSCT